MLPKEDEHLDLEKLGLFWSREYIEQIPTIENFDIEDFKEYLHGKFWEDLTKYFPEYNKREGYRFNLFMTSSKRELTSILFKKERYEYYFAVIMFHLCLYSQVICKVCDSSVMEYFHKASKCPCLSCGLGGYMHPAHTMVEAKLYPLSSRSRNIYVAYFRLIAPYLENEIVKFLSGGQENYNEIAYSYLVSEMSTKMDQFLEICHQVSDEMLTKLENAKGGREISDTIKSIPTYLLTKREMYGSE